MFFGLTIEKLLLIGVIAALIVGPDRLPRYAESLARLIARLREFLRGAKSRVRDEMGPEFDDVDWRRLDPRQYDPRRIIREALLEDAPIPGVKPVSAPPMASAGGAAAAGSQADVGGAAGRVASARPDPGAPPPFDSEAT